MNSRGIDKIMGEIAGSVKSASMIQAITDKRKVVLFIDIEWRDCPV
jgi:predicted RNase H-related nuclease YkuK (DUF458 family)